MYSLYTHYISRDSSDSSHKIVTSFHTLFLCHFTSHAFRAKRSLRAAVTLKGHPQTCPTGKKRQQYATWKLNWCQTGTVMWQSRQAVSLYISQHVSNAHAVTYVCVCMIYIYIYTYRSTFRDLCHPLFRWLRKQWQRIAVLPALPALPAQDRTSGAAAPCSPETLRDWWITFLSFLGV